MALVTLNQPAYWGIVSGNVAAGCANSDLIMDASGEAVAYIFQAPKTGTIAAVIPRIDAVVGTPPDLLCTIETVGTTGLPTGTLWATDTSASHTAVASTSPEITLTAAASVTAGDLLCVRFEWATAYSSGSVELRNYNMGGNSNRHSFPVVYHDTGAGFASSSLQPHPMMCLKYGDGSYVVPWGVWPPATISSLVIDSGTNPDEVGWYITAPAAMQVGGGYVWHQATADDAQFDVVTYSAAGTSPAVANTASIYHRAAQFLNPSTSTGVYFGKATDLVKDSDYAVVFSNPDTTSDFRLFYLDVADANHLGTAAGKLAWASRDGGTGAFTKTTTRIPAGAVMITAIDDGAGSGGGSFPRVQIDGVLG